MSTPIFEFRYSEAKLCDRIGISRTDMKFVRDRKLTADLDWKKVGGEVALSNRGLKRVWRELQARPATFDLRDCLLTAAKKNGATNGHSVAPRAAHRESVVGEVAPGAEMNGCTENGAILLGDRFAPIPLAVTVVKICENPYVVLAIDAHKQRLMIWVGRNVNYTVGMKIKVAPKIDQPGFWRVLGMPPRRQYSADEWERRQRAGLQG